ncbi:MAG: DUF4915 domain-containing protein [Nitrospinae bacterium]|nr:DUF4915 domain-containing protein [Nitrospinota bacterium]
MEQARHHDRNSLEISDLLAELDCTLVLGTHRAGRAAFLSANREGLVELRGQGGHRGRLELVDIGPGKGVWWGVSTSLSCLGLIDDKHGFRPRWHPPFISKRVPEDRCHLSGMTMGDDQPLYASALGDTDTAGGWRARMSSGGILMHVPSNEIILRDLPMPHSPRVFHGRLYFINSATGDLMMADPGSFTCETVTRLPGFARGLACFGDYLFVGVSPVSKEYRFSGMAISPRGAFAGIAVVHLPTGTLAGGIQVLTGHEEIYGIQVFPGQLRPDGLDRLVGPYRRALSILDNRSVNDPLRSWIRRIQELIEMPGSRIEGSRKDHKLGRRRLPQRLTQGMATAALTGVLIVGAGIGSVQAITPFNPQTALHNPFANGSLFYDQEVGTNVLSIFVDIDGDGDFDAFSHGGEDTPARFFENTGSKTSPSFVEQTGAANPLNSVVGSYITPTFVDIDGDGDFDAFSPGSYEDPHQFFKNTGSKTSPVLVEQTGAANSFNGVYVGGYNSTPSFVDIDGDGDFDAFVGASEGEIHYFQNTGTKTSPVLVERTGAANPFDGADVGSDSTPAFVDIDGDGEFEAFVGWGGGTIRHFDTPHNPFSFLCYQVSTTKKTPNFSPRNVQLSDQFDDRLFDVKKPDSLCTPADKNGEGIGDPATHLEGYQIKLAKGQPKHEKRTNVRIDNQFGTLFVDTKVADRLLVPTAKDLDNPVNPPDPSAHNVDHYKCYTFNVKKNICEDDPTVRCKTNTDCTKAGLPGGCNPGFPKGLEATVGDQFADPPKLFGISKPTSLCTPAEKEDEEIKNPSTHLMCYQVKPATGEPRHVPQVGIHLSNQFGSEQLDTSKEKELCVRSSKTLP